MYTALEHTKTQINLHFILLRCCNCGLPVINKRICYAMLYNPRGACYASGIYTPQDEVLGMPPRKLRSEKFPAEAGIGSVDQWVIGQ